MLLTAARRARRSVVAGLALVLATSATVVGSAPAAQSADKIVFNLVGTSDVSDSALMSRVIEPLFEAQFPQYDLQYVAKGTGAALTDARNGLAAAAIVHAAGIENQFVGDGFSLEQYGRLVFWGDYILLGPNSDPANIASAAPHDVVSAFEKIAAAGAAGQATFVTRGGTPGTAVQEHALWKLTSGVSTCTVGNPSGGGARPTASTVPGAVCINPDDDAVARPTWYRAGNAGSQATNVNIANTCAAASNPNGNCYVFTDRGTYKNLRAQGLAQNLKVVTRDNDAAARGGRDALINVFHAYGVNPAKFATANKTDAVAAKTFLDFMTATSTQAAIGAWLGGDGDQAFIPAAAPVTTFDLKTDKVKLGSKSTITGSIANAVPGYPALGGVPVTLLQASSGSALAVPRVVATATTDATGAFRFTKKLKQDRTYRVGVPQIDKIEIATLTPAFGGIISASSTVIGTVTGFKVKQRTVARAASGRIKLTGKLTSRSDGKGKVTAFIGQGGKLKRFDKAVVRDNKSRFVVTGKLAPGTYRVQLRFNDTGTTVPTVSKIFRVTIRR